MAVCEILSVGTEILLGDILNTNSRFLSVELAKLGISVLRHTTVGDNAERLSAALRTALDRSDIVIATGGLGPTQDDITRDVCCSVMGFELEYSPEIGEGIRKYFASKSIEMPESNLRQAYVPVGGTVFENHHGTAPGLGLKKGGKCVVILPGPPYEMAPMYKESVVPYLAEYSEGAIVSHTVRTMGIGESAMAEKVADLIEGSNPTVAPYAKKGEALLRVTAKAETESKAEELCRPVIDEIISRLGGVVYGIDSENIEQRVVELLKDNNMTIATAESCTAGYIPKRLTDIPGASEVFGCGIISYSNEIKQQLLGVKKETLDRFGAVSEQTAREMAAGVRRVSGADIGISVTGIAGPGSDGTDKPVGLCFIALDAEDMQTCEKVETGKNDREYNRYVNASRALNLARIYIERKGKQK
ncbi:MAG: competence/damage-inducible protein A [Oscillospiraceae bacterium]|nr:competence/damage-inducible protein A [Oscillospiraceae bacterium]